MKGKKGEPSAEDNEEKIELLTKKVIAIQQQIVIEQERTDRARTSEIECKKKIIEIESAFEQERKKLYSITTEMKEQHQRTEDELQAEIEKLREEEAGKKATIAKNMDTIANSKSDHEERMKSKELEITELKRKIEVITAEFARMLKDTLTKMQEKIEMQQWDSENDPQLMKKMQDLSESLVNK
jgi:hypothetical protein